MLTATYWLVHLALKWAIASHNASFQHNVMSCVFGPKILRSVFDSNKKNGGSKAAHELAQDVISFTVSIVLFVGYAVGAFMLSTTLESRTHGTSLLSYWAIQMHTGYTLYELILYTLFGKDAIMKLHHLLVLSENLGIICTGKLHFYCCWIGTVEGTNPCLSAVFVPKRLGQDPPMVAGAMLVLGFLFLRVLSLPFVFYQSVLDYKEVTLDSSVSTVQYMLGQFAIFAVWALSVYWFYRMVVGIMKILQKKDSKKEKSV